MEIGRKFISVSALAVAAGCAGISGSGIKLDQIRDVYVADFHSDEPESCRPSDVPLDHGRARHYFLRARIVDYKTIHDHYDVAPCYVEGTLTFREQSCRWTIDAGATAEIQCGESRWYAVCDECSDLWQDKTTK